MCWPILKTVSANEEIIVERDIKEEEECIALSEDQWPECEIKFETNMEMRSDTILTASTLEDSEDGQQVITNEADEDTFELPLHNSIGGVFSSHTQSSNDISYSELGLLQKEFKTGHSDDNENLDEVPCTEP